MATTELREKILTNELGNHMLNSVVQQYDNSAFTLHLFQAFGTVLSKEVDFIEDDFIKQIFPQTATWGLKYWEEVYGIIPDASKSIEQRRTYLIGLKYKLPPTTPKRIADMVAKLTGFECEVKELGGNKFKLIMYGYPKNINSVKNLLNEKTAAHLIYEIKGIERIETTTDIFPIVISNFSERIAEIGVIENTDKTIERIETNAYSFRTMVCGNISEKFNKIEVVN